MLLDLILELEAAVACQPSSPTPQSPNAQKPSHTPSSFPRALQSSHLQTAFQASLHEVLDEKIPQWITCTLLIILDPKHESAS